MDDATGRLAVSRWVVRHQVFIFYGNGGRFAGESFERWFAQLSAASNLRLYVGAAGHDFSFEPAERTRGTELFKRKGLRFAAITESVRLRLLGSTARLVGMNLGLYSWADSRRAFAEISAPAPIVEELHNTLLGLRAEVDREIGH
ncbi:MAG: hypothetical protein ABW321_19710 [Polyangiales bacterium]